MKRKMSTSINEYFELSLPEKNIILLGRTSI
jgi:hypothetical protein